MRYWGYLAAKLAVAGGILYGILIALNFFWPPLPTINDYFPRDVHNDFQYTLALGAWFLLCCGVLYLCILDQRYRCRVCLRRLRMPVERGSWGRMLLGGRPRTEYICPYGHGTLKDPELQISGHENAEWKQNAEMWDELCAQTKDEDSET
jgi:hypothetical protein